MPLQRALADSVVVVTGASSGIGAVTTRMLAARGASVVLAARGEAALEEVAARCRHGGGRAIAVPTDVTDPAAVDALADEAVRRFGHLDGWVNNAAVGTFAPLHRVPLPEVRRVLDVNLLAYLYGARAALPYLRESGGGVLVNVSSVLGVVTVPYLGAYNVSKHGVRALSASLRQDLRVAGERGISVCTVLPASIDTPFYRHAANHTGQAVGPIPPVYRPEIPARTIVRVLRRPRREAYAGWVGRLLAAQWSLTPGLVERVLGGYMPLTALGDEPAGPSAGNLFQPDTSTLRQVTQPSNRSNSLMSTITGR